MRVWGRATWRVGSRKLLLGCPGEVRVARLYHFRLAQGEVAYRDRSPGDRGARAGAGVDHLPYRAPDGRRAVSPARAEATLDVAEQRAPPPLRRGDFGRPSGRQLGARVQAAARHR